MSTHWVDTTWSGLEAITDPVLRVVVGRASEELGELQPLYGMSGPVRANSVSALAVAVESTVGVTGVMAFNRRHGVWDMTFMWTTPSRRRTGVANSLLEHALRDLPLAGIEGPYSLPGYHSSKRLGRRYGLVPSSSPYVRGHNDILKRVNPDWSLGIAPPLDELLVEGIEAELEMRRHVEPRDNLPELALSDVVNSPKWLRLAESLRALVLREWGVLL